MINEELQEKLLSVFDKRFENYNTIEELKKLKNKMAIEVLVFESLKHEELTKDFIDSFVNIMTKNYKDNIAFIEGIINGEK